ncbi:hypothetical protein AUJ77_00325 [Candidatus Nomurabacteria bacterium CG1_02_43_90]|uniref:Methyltransferase type 11 domain-containing protein n=1 Tax=Candidatus Nomurabacteria bacterium CG1_02_43_90 TaxID=1805281 RepID=A0A1J4V248_9BACT|nr:MAG: hypothetical protein AUJ77_00325 [Candidatus Nomurabacteria bacterium CG1_02_43_90]
MKTPLEHNIAAHDKSAKKYEQVHGEIYNDVEQTRLQSCLLKAVSSIQTGSNPVIALDFGCGAGNLTEHLTGLGCEVIAGDVSQGFLDLVAKRVYVMPVRTVKLNGIDLSGISDKSVDMVAMYSVLHHIPEYLSLMKEFSRVLKKGGVVYIDHEASLAFWNQPESYRKFLIEIKRKSRINLKKFFIATNYVDWIMRRFVDSRYQREGDIHVFLNDHVEWDKIREELKNVGIEELYEETYLLFRREYNQRVYQSYQKEIGDMHVFIGIKK